MLETHSHTCTKIHPKPQLKHDHQQQQWGPLYNIANVGSNKKKVVTHSHMWNFPSVARMTSSSSSMSVVCSEPKSQYWHCFSSTSRGSSNGHRVTRFSSKVPSDWVDNGPNPIRFSQTLRKNTIDGFQFKENNFLMFIFIEDICLFKILSKFQTKNLIISWEELPESLILPIYSSIGADVRDGQRNLWRILVGLILPCVISPRKTPDYPDSSRLPEMEAEVEFNFFFLPL